jgi:hypothetical protein
VYVKSIAFEASIYNNMWIYLVNRSMITNMLSYSTLIIGSFNSGSLMIKSIMMDYQALLGVLRDCILLYGLC